MKPGNIIVTASTVGPDGMLETKLYSWKFGEPLSEENALPLSSAYTSKYAGVHGVVADPLRRWLYLGTTERSSGLPAIVRADFDLTQPVLLHRGKAGEEPILRLMLDAPEGDTGNVIFQNGRSGQLRLLPLGPESLVPARFTGAAPIIGRRLLSPSATDNATDSEVPGHEACMASDQTRVVFPRDRRVYTLAWFDRDGGVTTLCSCPSSSGNSSQCEILFEDFPTGAPSTDPVVEAGRIYWMTQDQELIRSDLRRGVTPEVLSRLPAEERAVSLAAGQAADGSAEMLFTSGCTLDTHFAGDACDQAGSAGRHPATLGGEPVMDPSLVFPSGYTAVYYVPWPEDHVFTPYPTPVNTEVPTAPTSFPTSLREVEVRTLPPPAPLCAGGWFPITSLDALRCVPWWVWLVLAVLLVLLILLICWCCCRNKKDKTVPEEPPPAPPADDEELKPMVSPTEEPREVKLFLDESADAKALNTPEPQGDPLEAGGYESDEQEPFYHIHFQDPEEEGQK